MECWDVIKTGQLGKIFDEGSAKDQGIAMDGSQKSGKVSAQTARGGWPVGGKTSEMNGSTCGGLTGRQLQVQDAESSKADSPALREWCHGPLALRECAD